MKIAVTGAAGLVGRYVVDELAAHQYEVLALNHRYDPNCKFEQKVVELTDFGQVMEAVRGCDAVIHVAGIPGPRRDMDSSVFENNLMCNYNMVLACGLQSINRLAIASSDCALGITWAHRRINRVVYLPVDEEHPASPDDGYGISKLLSEKMCDLMAIRFPEMSISSLRITHVTTPADYTDPMRRQSLFGDPNRGPNNLWSYIDARDSAMAFRLAIEKNIVGHQVYYIAARNSRYKVPSLELAKKYFPDAEIREPFGGYDSFESTRKAERMLGFVAQYRWDE